MCCTQLVALTDSEQNSIIKIWTSFIPALISNSSWGRDPSCNGLIFILLLNTLYLITIAVSQHRGCVLWGLHLKTDCITPAVPFQRLLHTNKHKKEHASFPRKHHLSHDSLCPLWCKPIHSQISQNIKTKLLVLICWLISVIRLLWMRTACLPQLHRWTNHLWTKTVALQTKSIWKHSANAQWYNTWAATCRHVFNDQLLRSQRLIALQVKPLLMWSRRAIWTENNTVLMK